MNLKDFLAKKGKISKSDSKVWLPLCTLDVTTGALWAGDPHLANADDGHVTKVPAGRYVVEGVGLVEGRQRVVSKLRVRLESAKNPTAGKELGDTGTDSGMIGVCDIKAFDKACAKAVDGEVQDAIEAQTDDGFGIIKLKKFPGTVMPFIPTGSDGGGPVVALMAGGKRVGIELSFDGSDDEGEAKHEAPKITLKRDTNGYIERRMPDGSKAAFWLGGHLKADTEFSLWSSAENGPVQYRIRKAGGGTVRGWTALKPGRNEPARAYDTLKAGKYEIDFQVGKEIYSALKLTLK